MGHIGQMPVEITRFASEAMQAGPNAVICEVCVPADQSSINCCTSLKMRACSLRWASMPGIHRLSSYHPTLTAHSTRLTFLSSHILTEAELSSGGPLEAGTTASRGTARQHSLGSEQHMEPRPHLATFSLLMEYIIMKESCQIWQMP